MLQRLLALAIHILTSVRIIADVGVIVHMLLSIIKQQVIFNNDYFQPLSKGPAALPMPILLTGSSAIRVYLMQEPAGA